MRFYLVDKVTSLVPGEYAEGIKCVTKSEDFLEQHFHGYPVMPGVLIVESLAQLSGYFLSKTMEEKGKMLFAILSIIEKAKFYKMVVPGDQMYMKTSLITIKDNSAIVQAVAFVDSKKVVSARLMFVFYSPVNKKMEENVLMRKRMFRGFENDSFFEE